jgi:hypothetical protein
MSDQLPVLTQASPSVLHMGDWVVVVVTAVTLQDAGKQSNGHTGNVEQLLVLNSGWCQLL